MSVLHQVEGKTFLITGGASGLGKGYVEAFLQEGAKSVAILDINEEAGKSHADKLNKVYPGKVVFIKCDISSEEELTEAFNEVVNRFKTVDVLINNAGVLNDSPQTWRKASCVNFNGMVSLTFKGLKHMSKDEGGQGGTIINVSSQTAFLRLPSIPAYAGAKAGILHFTYCISDGIGEETGVRVMTICFGATDTPLLENAMQKGYDPKKTNGISAELMPHMHVFDLQKAESGVKGVVDAFKQGSNGTVWHSSHDKPVQDITSTIAKSYEWLRNELYPPPK
ncbi:hypothetical protein ABMA27_005753 [Loxostege sticticalis]|uniref:15-hydroxyprostaglandin dehydrogenase [NAD(+)] n=1 Tax=Loxostege sticticalis TaxID=481309 RepID=A0ABR3HGD3_LOXSC